MNVVSKGIWAAALLLGAAAEGDAQLQDGKRLYLENCRTCHGVSGNPSKQNQAKYPRIKSLADPALYLTRSDDSLRAVVKNGAGRDMKGFGDKLSAGEIGAIVEYLHVLAKPRAKP